MYFELELSERFDAYGTAIFWGIYKLDILMFEFLG